MKVGRAEVETMAALAQIELGAEEMARLERDLNAVLEYVGQLQRIDTTGVEPMAHATGEGEEAAASAARLRPDEPRHWFGAAEALANAPAAGRDMFLVPRILERN